MDRDSHEALRLQYELLAREVLEIHSRSDRLEQFFVVTLGAIYGFALTRPNELEGYVYLVPCAIAYFAFIRLELLSRVRGIARVKQIEIERVLNGESIQGPAEHFQTAFYQSAVPKIEREVTFLTLFEAAVSDRAGFWRLAVFLSALVAIAMNISALRAAINTPG